MGVKISNFHPICLLDGSSRIVSAAHVDDLTQQDKNFVNGNNSLKRPQAQYLNNRPQSKKQTSTKTRRIIITRRRREGEK